MADSFNLGIAKSNDLRIIIGAARDSSSHAAPSLKRT
jgi:hypothetical protein